MVATTSDLLRAYATMQKRAEDLLIALRLSPGGDEYTYVGSTNDVDALYDAIRNVEKMFQKGRPK